MEKTKNKREWVKTALIIFLSIMLVLTFFSNTIMNYSLPEVATQYMWGGNVTNKIRASGVVSASDPYEVAAKEERTVESVQVYQGNTVQKGDVLYVLMSGESSEISAAYEMYEQLLKTFENRIITEGISTTMMNRVKNGTTASFDKNQKQLENLRNAVDAAQKNVDTIQQNIENLEKQRDLLELNGGDTAKEREAVKKAETDYKNAVQSNKNADSLLAAAVNAFIAKGGDPDTDTYPAGDSDAEAAYRDLLFWRQAKVNAANGVEFAKEALDEAQAALEKKESAEVAAITKQISALNLSLQDATQKLTDAQAKLGEVNGDILTEMSLQKDWEAIKAAKSKWEALCDNESVDYITAPISGTVTSINYVAGNKFNAGDTLAVIQPEGSRYKVRMTVTNEQARRIYVGDVADISDSWYYYDLKATVESIKPDPQNPQKNKIVTCELSGECTPGQQLTLTMGQTSNYYDKVVPTNCIHEDNKGKFIYVVNVKGSPLGNRYYAQRVDVTVLTSDETQTAISTDVYTAESVITSSSKPIKGGDQVRLSQN